MRSILLVIAFLHLIVGFGQTEYEAEEFVSEGDLKFAVKQMQRSDYIGSAIVCEQSSTDICDSLESVSLEASKGSIQLPISSFSFINHYAVDSNQTMSADYPQINRLIILTQPGESVSSVFEGEVTSIFEIPGNAHVVMIKKGAYRLVYGSLDSVCVNVGQWVNNGDPIGAVSDHNAGQMIFEIWKTKHGQSLTERIEDWIEISH